MLKLVLENATNGMTLGGSVSPEPEWYHKMWIGGTENTSKNLFPGFYRNALTLGTIVKSFMRALIDCSVHNSDCYSSNSTNGGTCNSLTSRFILR
jgi:hypothetical protein